MFINNGKISEAYLFKIRIELTLFPFETVQRLATFI